MKGLFLLGYSFFLFFSSPCLGMEDQQGKMPAYQFTEDKGSQETIRAVSFSDEVPAVEPEIFFGLADPKNSDKGNKFKCSLWEVPRTGTLPAPPLPDICFHHSLSTLKTSRFILFRNLRL